MRKTTKSRSRVGVGISPDQVIEIMRGVKRGSVVQRRSKSDPKWRDINMKLLMQESVQYRLKPIKAK